MSYPAPIVPPSPNNQLTDITANSATQAPVQRSHQIDAAIRAALIDRDADFQLQLGRHAAAERLSHRALELRGVADHAKAANLNATVFNLAETRQ